MIKIAIGVVFVPWTADVMPRTGQKIWFLQIFHVEAYNSVIFGIVVVPPDTDPNLWIRIGSLVTPHPTYAPDGQPYTVGEIQTITLV